MRVQHMSSFTMATQQHKRKIGVEYGIASDFDLMLDRRKKRCRKVGNDSSINRNQDFVKDVIKSMHEAAKMDWELVNKGQIAFNKTKLLPYVVNHLEMAHLHDMFVEARILNVMAEWLFPLPPDKKLPHYTIRTTFFKFFQDMRVSKEQILESGIIQVLLILVKHPKEENKMIIHNILHHFRLYIDGRINRATS